jgi:hypothetical protein
MRTAADNFVGASVKLTWENEKVSFCELGSGHF